MGGSIHTATCSVVRTRLVSIGLSVTWVVKPEPAVRCTLAEFAGAGAGPCMTIPAMSPRAVSALDVLLMGHQFEMFKLHTRANTA